MKIIQILVVLSLCSVFSNSCLAEDYPTISARLSLYDAKSRVPIKADIQLILTFETQKCLPPGTEPEELNAYTDTISLSSSSGFIYTYLYHFKAYHLKVSHPIYGDTILSERFPQCESHIRLSIALDKPFVEKNCRELREIVQDIKKFDYVFVDSVRTFDDSVRLDSQYILFEELRQSADDEELKSMIQRDDPQIAALAWKALTINNLAEGFKCIREKYLEFLWIQLYGECKGYEKIYLEKYMIIEFEKIILENGLKIHQSELDEYYEYRRRKFHILRK